MHVHTISRSIIRFMITSLFTSYVLFIGTLGERSGSNMEVILYWELASLFREGSLIDKLINEDKSKLNHSDIIMI